MQRRAFIAGGAGASVGWPLAVRGQQTTSSSAVRTPIGLNSIPIGWTFAY
jgi:hypothetical protein